MKAFNVFLSPILGFLPMLILFCDCEFVVKIASEEVIVRKEDYPSYLFPVEITNVSQDTCEIYDRPLIGYEDEYALVFISLYREKGGAFEKVQIHPRGIQILYFRNISLPPSSSVIYEMHPYTLTEELETGRYKIVVFYRRWQSHDGNIYTTYSSNPLYLNIVE